jgi:ferric iron reductase protein FhuF
MPFVDAVSDLTNLSRRGLWGQIMSSCGSAIVWAAQLAGRGTAGIEEAGAFLNDPGAAFLDPPSFHRLHLRGEELVAMRRGVCCLAYRLSDAPYCSTCPLISDDERDKRQREEWDAGRG